MKTRWLALAFFVIGASRVFANGGAWQTGVPGTGNANASKNDRHTDVTIENETLKIDTPSARQRNLLVCSATPVFTRWDWQITHALDFGVPALHDCAAHLLRQGVQPVGMKIPTRNACAPSFFSICNGKKIALLAISAFDATATSEIATASNRADLNAAIADARSNANLVACLVHWGTENSVNISDEQRELARWLIDHGVDLVVGSHPHCVQPLDSYHGHLIAYSLGNLVFDGASTVASWNRGALLEVGLNDDAKISSVSLIPIALEDGLPQLNVFQDNRLGSR
jgi:poly-gamma-glutamate capsule biosynthesis protein CapA/YwtB (metallophosphatase superfamily)